MIRWFRLRGALLNNLLTGKGHSARVCLTFMAEPLRLGLIRIVVNISSTVLHSWERSPVSTAAIAIECVWSETLNRASGSAIYRSKEDSCPSAKQCRLNLTKHILMSLNLNLLPTPKLSHEYDKNKEQISTTRCTHHVSLQSSLVIEIRRSTAGIFLSDVSHRNEALKVNQT